MEGAESMGLGLFDAFFFSKDTIYIYSGRLRSGRRREIPLETVNRFIFSTHLTDPSTMGLYIHGMIKFIVWCVRAATVVSEDEE